MRETASAPAASTAFAISVISVTLGESLTTSGFLVACRTAAVMRSAESQCTPNAAPPFFTFGQEIFSSIMWTSVWSSRSAIVTHSSMVEPAMLARITVSLVSRYGSSRSIKASMPGFCKPTEFSMPDGVSAIRGEGLPGRGVMVVPLVAIPPTLESGNSSSYSCPYPNTPEAGIIGFLNGTPAT